LFRYRSIALLIAGASLGGCQLLAGISVIDSTPGAEGGLPDADAPGDVGADIDGTLPTDAPEDARDAADASDAAEASDATTGDGAAGDAADATANDAGDASDGGDASGPSDASDASDGSDASDASDAGQAPEGGPPPWIESDLGLYGGTVNAIAPHPNDPNTLFACTNGGLFKTSNAGVSWSRLSTGLPLACGAVAVGPSNGDHIYTADIGYASLAASTDEGMTWTIEPLPDIFFNAAHSGTQGLLVVDPLNSGTLFVQTASSLVESKDGGGTWTNVGGTLSPVASLLLAKNVVALDIGNVAVLQDGGSWNTLTVPPFFTGPTAQALAYDGTNYLYASFDYFADAGQAGIYTSPDLQTWHLTDVQTNLASVLATSTPPAYAFSGYTGYRSGDHGMTWSIFSLDTYTAQAFALDANSQLWLGDTGAGVRFSANQGTTFSPRNVGITAVSPTSIAVDPNAPTNVYLGAPIQALFKSSDGGMTWASSGVGMDSQATITSIAIDPQNSSYVYAADPGGISGTVYASDNAGASWSTAITPGSGIFNSVAVDPRNGTVYAAGNGQIKISMDHFATSTAAAALPGGTNDNMLVVRPQDGAVFLCTGTGLFISTNAGQSFSMILAGPVVSVAPSPTILNTIYAATASTVFVTVTGGQTWAQVSGAPTGGTLVMNPSNQQALYLATTTGLLSTSNGGTTWTSHDSGLPVITIPPLSSAIGVDPTAFGTVYLGVSNRGLWKTTTGGQ